MRKLVMVAAVVLSASLAEAEQSRLTHADADAVDAIEKQLNDATKALLFIQKGTPFTSPSFECYGGASEAAGTLAGSVDTLAELISLATLMRHQEDTLTVEQRVAQVAAKVVQIADVTEKWVYGLEGSCSQDNLAVFKLNSLLELIGRARQKAAMLKARLSQPVTHQSR